MRVTLALSGFILSFSLCLFLLSPLQAQESKQESKPDQSVQYDVYAGGIHALQSNLEINFSEKGRYSTTLTAKTYGLLGRLAPWQGTFESHGWRGDVIKGRPNKPELHKSTATWRGEDEIKEYSYKKDGSFNEYRITDDKYDGAPKEVDPELTQGTTDILTSTLNTMQLIAAGNDCEGTSEIFDGKRRFKMVFRQKDEVELKASKWNAYAGPAIQCTVEVQPVAGKWYEKPRGWMSIQEQGRARGTMPTVWFARINEDKPAIPVKVRVKTSYGTLFMHMTQYDDGGITLATKD